MLPSAFCLASAVMEALISMFSHITTMTDEWSESVVFLSNHSFAGGRIEQRQMTVKSFYEYPSPSTNKGLYLK